MPNAPLHPCGHPGCSALLPRGQNRCERHKKKRDYHAEDKERGSSRQRGYGAKWDKLTKTYLANHPDCVGYPLKRGCPTSAKAKIVDHIEPHKGDANKFWDEDNLQGLCPSCHSRKTAQRDGGFGNPIKED